MRWKVTIAGTHLLMGRFPRESSGVVMALVELSTSHIIAAALTYDGKPRVLRGSVGM
jgi:hypothetical protein